MVSTRICYYVPMNKMLLISLVLLVTVGACSQKDTYTRDEVDNLIRYATTELENKLKTLIEPTPISPSPVYQESAPVKNIEPTPVSTIVLKEYFGCDGLEKLIPQLKSVAGVSMSWYQVVMIGDPASCDRLIDKLNKPENYKGMSHVGPSYGSVDAKPPECLKDPLLPVCEEFCYLLFLHHGGGVNGATRMMHNVHCRQWSAGAWWMVEVVNANK